jgi:hypothetical protein
MLGSAISNILMFFMIVTAAVIFVAVWIMKSEARINAARAQLKALRSRLEAGERERYMLAERLSSEKEAALLPPEAQPAKEDALKPKAKGAAKKELEEALKAKAAVEEENIKLKSELAEATASLTEVYKALCEK